MVVRPRLPDGCAPVKSLVGGCDESVRKMNVELGCLCMIDVILPLPRMQSWAQALWDGHPSVSSQQQACTWGQLSYDQNSSVVRLAYKIVLFEAIYIR